MSTYFLVNDSCSSIFTHEPDTRSNLMNILEMFGFEPLAVGSREEALAHPSLTTGDVILLDRKLPGGSRSDLIHAEDQQQIPRPLQRASGWKRWP